tara:strand:- start:60 stop:1469 length:1410 start_codon:yes stop_codon:yes gene_type:complete
MAITLQIKRSTATSAPSSLSDGELAYTHGAGTQANLGKRAFIGDSSNNVTVIGGQYFTDMMDHVHGTLTANSAVIVDSSKRIDDLLVGINSTTGGSIKLNEGTNNGNHYLELKGPNALGSNLTFTLPSSDGSANGVMSTNGSGALSFMSFDTADFTINGSTIELRQNPSAFTAITVDNIKIGDADSQTISTSSGNLILNPAGEINASSNRILNVAAPQDATDAANKEYVDGQLQGLDIKDSVRVATSSGTNITLGSGAANGSTIDGVSVATGDRILLKHQSTGSENGIYTVNASGAPTRATDFDSSADVSAGAFVFVEEGNNADQGFVLTNNGTITIGSTALTFTQFSGAGNVVAGAGMTKTGSTLDVVGTSARISVAANSIDIDANYVGQTSITTLGTIATGTWNATAIAATKGGTGLTTIPKGSLLVANTADTLTALDGGGTSDKLAIYDYSNDTWGVSNSLDGGTF